MPKPKTKPLPSPFTLEAAVEHLYRAWTNNGKIQIDRIDLLNPHMVTALYHMWQSEHAHEYTSSEQIQPTGFIAKIGCWTLVRKSAGTGILLRERSAEPYICYHD